MNVLEESAQNFIEGCKQRGVELFVVDGELRIIAPTKKQVEVLSLMGYLLYDEIIEQLSQPRLRLVKC